MYATSYNWIQIKLSRSNSDLRPNKWQGHEVHVIPTVQQSGYQLTVSILYFLQKFEKYTRHIITLLDVSKAIRVVSSYYYYTVRYIGSLPDKKQ